jgi:hypothetical protein
MIESTEPFWYKLIISEKEKGEITTGLTIPFIIGAKSVNDESYVPSENSISELLDEIIASSTEQVAFFQECPRIRQYVIGLTERNSPEAEENSEIIFTNSNGDKTLYISGDAKNFGTDVEEISTNLNKLWLPTLMEKRFSWDKSNTDWTVFLDEEVTRIKAL